MKRLTNKEEEILKILWRLDRAFVKDIQAEFKTNPPHYNTLSTMVRNLEEKGYVSYHAFGKTHQYYPIISKETYRKKFISTALEEYFSNSYKNLVSTFAREEKISLEELKEIIDQIEKEK
ncbi:MAG: BlaI/MecI/CopY family transcriptional regulator [Flavobacteriaceae bacterium]